MRPRVQTHAWAYEGTRADAHFTSIETNEVEVDVDVFAELEVGAVVDAERGFDPGVVLQELLVFFRGGGGCWERGAIVDDAESLIS